MAQRIGDIQRSEVKIRVTSRPQRKLRRVPSVRAKITGPCFFRCLFTTKRRVSGIPIWSRIPEACATTSVPAGAGVCNRCYNSEVRAARNQARCRRWPERQDADYGVEGDIESRSSIRRMLYLGTTVLVLRVIAARAMAPRRAKHSLWVTFWRLKGYSAMVGRITGMPISTTVAGRIQTP